MNNYFKKQTNAFGKRFALWEKFSSIKGSRNSKLFKCILIGTEKIYLRKATIDCKLLKIMLARQLNQVNILRY